MARKSAGSTTVTKPATAKKPAAKKSTSKTPSKCTLLIKPKVLSETLGLLHTGITSNSQGMDRLNIKVGNGQSIFRVAGDISIDVTYKANKNLPPADVKVSCKQIKDLANGLDSSSQRLTLESGSVSVSNYKNTYSHGLTTYKDSVPEDAAEYEPRVKVKAATFKRALDKVISFTDSDSKKIISGICLQIKQGGDDADADGIEIILSAVSGSSMLATTRMSVESADKDNLSPEDILFVLPKRAATFIANKAEDFTLSVAETSVKFEWSNVVCKVQTLKGKFPDVEKVIADTSGNDVEVEFNRSDLIGALKRHKVNSTEVEFSIEDENCRLSQANDSGSGAENIYCGNEDNISLTLNLPIDNLVKILQSVEDQTVTFYLDLEPEEGETEPSNSVLIKSENGNTVYCLAQLLADSNEVEDEVEDEEDLTVEAGDEEE